MVGASAVAGTGPLASNGGDDEYPGWWYNIHSNPNVEIQVGREIVSCRAEQASAADRFRLLAKLTAVYGGYDRYRQRTTRDLTIFRLKPSPPHEPTRKAPPG